jgi:hypothetical protein
MNKDVKGKKGSHTHNLSSIYNGKRALSTTNTYTTHKYTQIHTKKTNKRYGEGKKKTTKTH